jgi:hypothetical protein
VAEANGSCGRLRGHQCSAVITHATSSVSARSALRRWNDPGWAGYRRRQAQRLLRRSVDRAMAEWSSNGRRSRYTWVTFVPRAVRAVPDLASFATMVRRR